MNKSKKKVLVIVAHTDDESFGCGGLIKKLSTQKNIIKAISFTNGVGSRDKQTEKDIKKRKINSINAAKILGFKWLAQYDYPDNQMDKYSILEYVKIIESHKKKFSPDIILTHNFYDLNVDHRIVAEATITAFRPEPKSTYTEIMTFEVPSSTDFRMLNRSKNFIPNHFVNVEKYLKFKLNAIKCYKNELKKSPHSRSLNGIKNLSKIRGNQSGVKNAEAFEIIRRIDRTQ